MGLVLAAGGARGGDGGLFALIELSWRILQLARRRSKIKAQEKENAIAAHAHSHVRSRKGGAHNA